MFDDENKFETDNGENDKQSYDSLGDAASNQSGDSYYHRKTNEDEQESQETQSFNGQNDQNDQNDQSDAYNQNVSYNQGSQDNQYKQNNEYDPNNQYGQNQRNNRVVNSKKHNNGMWIALAIVACTFIIVTGCVWAAVSYFDTFKDNNNTQQAAVQENGEQIVEETEEQKITSTLTKADINSTSTVTAAVVDFSGVVKEVLPSVVAITNTMLYTSNVSGFYGQQQTQEGVASGSGVIIGQNEEELLIVTNAHVVTEDESTSYYYTVSLEGIQVTFYGDVTVDAYVKGTDEEADLAVIAVKLEDIDEDTKNNIKIASVGDSTECEIGNCVVAIGNALGYGQSATYGIISALDRAVTDSNGNVRIMIQTDAAINPGNSGGGMFDVNGHLIGINSAKYSDTTVEGMGFAIPISNAEDIITELMNTTPRVAYSEEEQGYIGFTGQDLSSTLISMGYPSGAMVTKTSEGLAAEKAGIQMYDIITAINDVSVTSMNSLKAELKYYKAGETVTLTIMRVQNNSFQEMQVEVTLSSYEEMYNSSVQQ